MLDDYSAQGIDNLLRKLLLLASICLDRIIWAVRHGVIAWNMSVHITTMASDRCCGRPFGTGVDLGVSVLIKAFANRQGC
jgi:hypothetical protein